MLEHKKKKGTCVDDFLHDERPPPVGHVLAVDVEPLETLGRGNSPLHNEDSSRPLRETADNNA